MKWFEVQVSIVKTYTVQAHNEEDAMDWVTEECDAYDEMQVVELKTEEEIARSRRHSDEIIYGE